MNHFTEILIYVTFQVFHWQLAHILLQCAVETAVDFCPESMGKSLLGRTEGVIAQLDSAGVLVLLKHIYGIVLSSKIFYRVINTLKNG